MKLGIIGGAGLLGSASAFYAAIRNLADEIILVDSKKNWVVNHAVDLDQGVCEISSTRIFAGEMDDLSACGIILNTAGAPERLAASRDAYLEENLKIYAEIGDKIRSWGTNPVLVSATNPIDVLNGRFHEMVGGPAEKFIGYSKNDTLRFKWSISKETGIPAPLIQACVLGEHGEKQVPIFSSVKRKDTGEAIALSSGQRRNILTRVQSWFGEMVALQVPRTMGWTSGIGLGEMIERICIESDEIIPCSCIPHGEYGLDGISIGLPVRLGRHGVREIVEIPLEDDEMEKLREAAGKILRQFRQ
jgi:malate/lactate dehydrogenase